MAEYHIRPVAYCEGVVDLSVETYRMNLGVSSKSVGYVWYIEGSKPKVLIDAGEKGPYSGRPTVKDLISVGDGLAKLGLTPEDIEIVIVTHLHKDHIMLGHLFKNARFIVQKKEIEYARNPHKIDAYLFNAEYFEDLNLEVIDGEKEIIPGVSVFFSPGHTPGGQSVEINTPAGKAVITGFCSCRDNFTQTEPMKRMGWEVCVPSIHSDIWQIYNSMLEVKRRADIIVPLHDPSFADKERIP